VWSTSKNPEVKVTIAALPALANADDESIVTMTVPFETVPCTEGSAAALFGPVGELQLSRKEPKIDGMDKIATPCAVFMKNSFLVICIMFYLLLLIESDFKGKILAHTFPFLYIFYLVIIFINNGTFNSLFNMCNGYHNTCNY
jgi:hypothetical protein